MNLLYIVYGTKIEYHVQAYVSMLSMRAREIDAEIWIVTDQPDYYKALGFVNVLKIAPGEVDEWISVTGYSFRAKIKAIQKFVEYTEGKKPFVFVDTDTIAFEDFRYVIKDVQDGFGVMYENEGHPSNMRGNSKKMWNAIEGKTVAEITFDQKHVMWNSCIIGMPAKEQKEVIQEALDVCDYIYNIYPRCFCVEQYAVGIAMSHHYEMKEAKDKILHYWGNKDGWQKYIESIVLGFTMKGLSTDEQIMEIGNMDMRKVPVFIHKSSTKRRIERLIARMFHDKDVRYL